MEPKSPKPFLADEGGGQEAASTRKSHVQMKSGSGSQLQCGLKKSSVVSVVPVESSGTVVGKATGPASSTSTMGVMTVENHLSVLELGDAIILTFRRKSLAILIVQSIGINAIAFCVDRFAPIPDTDSALVLCMAAWALPTVCLMLLYYYRLRKPVNLILLVVFSIAIGVTLGLLRVPMEWYTLNFHSGREIWSPQCYGMAGHTIALMLLAALSCVPHGSRGLAKVAPIAVFVGVFTNILGIVLHAKYWNYVGPTSFLVIALILNIFSIAWVGYNLDDLSAKLQVDEIFYPAILIWTELLITVCSLTLICLVCVSGECAAPDCCEGWFCYAVWCDCYYTDGYHQETRARGDDPEAPAQNRMSGTAQIRDTE